ncbi:CopG family ribbon-helix-helix protein [Lichenicoccus roseus]|uniref:CopG family transcriptional regulator n=1 Tax=Lichenicoccus roseus TaxID=2683649 RepID=A0A5R9J2C8_9PROT|nr:CopG family transcriptional regulator [Lichenicoccus roseus]TLU70637.1 CopG family transcriptional regulator [Lichenicoccus roseus]
MHTGAPRGAITVRLEAAKRAELDELARATSRDRSFLVNEAIDAYLAVHRWQIARIEEGLRQAEAGEFASEDEVNAAFARWQ